MLILVDQEEILKQQSEILADIAKYNDHEPKKQPSASTDHTLTQSNTHIHRYTSPTQNVKPKPYTWFKGLYFRPKHPTNIFPNKPAPTKTTPITPEVTLSEPRFEPRSADATNLPVLRGETKIKQIREHAQSWTKRSYQFNRLTITNLPKEIKNHIRRYFTHHIKTDHHILSGKGIPIDTLPLGVREFFKTGRYLHLFAALSPFHLCLATKVIKRRYPSISSIVTNCFIQLLTLATLEAWWKLKLIHKGTYIWLAQNKKFLDDWNPRIELIEVLLTHIDSLETHPLRRANPFFTKKSSHLDADVFHQIQLSALQIDRRVWDY